MKNIICILLILIISINIFSSQISKGKTVKARSEESTSNKQVYKTLNKKQITHEAEENAKNSKYPLLWGIVSFASVLLLSDYLIYFIGVKTIENSIFGYGACCLAVTSLAFLVAPRVSQNNIENESIDYKAEYKNSYIKQISMNNGLAAFFGGAIAFVIRTIFLLVILTLGIMSSNY